MLFSLQLISSFRANANMHFCYSFAIYTNTVKTLLCLSIEQKTSASVPSGGTMPNHPLICTTVLLPEKKKKKKERAATLELV